MAIKCISNGGSAADCRPEFVLDSVDDVKDLPAACPGSIAFVVDGSHTVYMVNASGEWREF